MINEIRNIVQSIVIVGNYPIFIWLLVTSVLFFVQYRQHRTVANKVFTLTLLGLTFDRFVSIAVGKFQLVYFGWGLDVLVLFFLGCRLVSQILMIIAFYLFCKDIVIPKVVPEIRRRIKEL